MIIPNNFKEIRITPNEDSTLKVEYYGVVFQDKDGKQLESVTVTYPRVKINIPTFYYSTKYKIDIEILPDGKEQELEIIYIPEDE